MLPHQRTLRDLLFASLGALAFGALCLLPSGMAFAQSVEPALPPPAILELSLEPPTLITEPGPEYSEDRLDYAMTIGIERTPKGRLWAAWVAGGDSDKGLFVLGSSDDDGLTWKTPRLVIDPPEAPTGLRRRTLVGNLWTDPTGKLWLFFDQSMGYYDGRAGDWAIICDDPDAETPKWSAPRRIWHGATLNKPTVLKSGEWLLPISLWQRGKIGPKELKTAYPELDSMRMANVFVSSDNGATWTRRGGVSFPNHDFDEHMIVERRDRTLWMLARTTAGMMQSLSNDEGRTWSKPTIAYPHINARFFIRRLASGNLLMVRHGKMDERTPKRSHLTAWLSSDDGGSWRGGLILDERNGVSYPDGFQAPDGRIYVSYDRERAKEREILLAVFTEADVEAGQIVAGNGKSRLKGLIHKARGGLPSVTAVTVETKKPADKKRVDTSGSTEQWARQAELDAQEDRTSIPYDGKSPNKLVCDTTLRQLPDGSWALFMLAGDDIEPSPGNYTGVIRSTDEGKTWTPLEPVDLGFPRKGTTSGQGPTELMVPGEPCDALLLDTLADLGPRLAVLEHHQR